MHLRLLLNAVSLAIGGVLLVVTASAENRQTPRIPGATLLVGSFQPDSYLLTTNDGTLTLQEDKFGLGIGAEPSVSEDGSIVAASRGVGNMRGAPGRVLSIYSVKDAKWKDYPEVKGVWELAISPDGTKVACVIKDWQVKPSVQLVFRLTVVDLASGKIAVVNESSDPPMGVSWSPDDRHIVFDAQALGYHAGRNIRKIDVLDVETGQMIQIAIGQAASWSPSGDWIAYFSYVRDDSLPRYANDFYDGHYYPAGKNRVSLMSPDGTRSRDVAVNVGGILKPVWSPDSQALLIYTCRSQDYGIFDTYLVNLADHKSKRIFKDADPVYGWATDK
jgi:Tol biopolymer transport system component